MNTQDTAHNQQNFSRRYTTYRWHLGLAIALYVVLLFAYLRISENIGPSLWAMLLALGPAAALIAVGGAVLRLYRVMDELEQRILTENLALSFALGAIITFTIGLMQLSGLPELNWMGVWVVFGASWFVVSIGRLIRGRLTAN